MVSLLMAALNNAQIKQGFPILRASALKCHLFLEAHNYANNFFFKMNTTESRCRSTLKRVATSSVRLNTKRLVKQKSFQISH